MNTTESWQSPAVSKEKGVIGIVKRSNDLWTVYRSDRPADRFRAAWLNPAGLSQRVISRGIGRSGAGSPGICRTAALKTRMRPIVEFIKGVLFL